MRKIIVAAVALVLIYFFFHMRRVDQIDGIYEATVARLDKGDLKAAMSGLKKMKDYEGHESLRERIADCREKVYLRIRDDMLAMAEKKNYAQPEGYSACGAYAVLLEYEPVPDWMAESFNELAEIVLSDEMYFLEAETEDQLRVGKDLYSHLTKNELIASNLRDRLGAIREQLSLCSYYRYRNWEGKVQKEIRNGKPFYFQ